MTEKIVMFSPLGVRPHLRFEKILASFLSRVPSDVVVVGCESDFIGACSLHVGSSRQTFAEICRKCTAHTKSIWDTASSAYFEIDQFLSSAEDARVSRLCEGLNLQEIEDFEVDGVPLGRYIAYDFSLAYRSASLPRDPRILETIASAATSATRAYFAGRAVVERMSPSALTVYSREYGLNRAFAAAFASSDIPVFNVHQRGPSHNRFWSFSCSRKDSADNPLVDSRFDSVAQIPVSVRELGTITRHALGMVRGSSALSYSPKPGTQGRSRIREQRRGSAGRPLVLVALSSPEERLAAIKAGFMPDDFHSISDIDFARTLVEVARLMPYVDFVFRLHPRMFQGAGRTNDSAEVSELLKLVMGEANRAKNVTIDHPQADISLYDYWGVIQCAVGYRSSALIELGLLGVPVVQMEPSYDPLARFSTERHERPTSNEVVKLIEGSLQSRRPSGEGYLRYLAISIVRLNVPIGTKIQSIGRKLPRISLRRLKIGPIALPAPAIVQPDPSLLRLRIGGRRPVDHRSALDALNMWSEWPDETPKPRMNLDRWFGRSLRVMVRLYVLFLRLRAFFNDQLRPQARASRIGAY